MEKLTRWKYRVKVAEKLGYVLLMAFGFVLYKSPSLLHYFLAEKLPWSLSLFSSAVIAFSLSHFYIDKRAHELEQKSKILREQLKDAKRNLLHHMDPVIVDTLKEIVKKDLQQEIQQMR